MDEQWRSKLAIAAGDVCGGLACFSVGFAIFVAVLSFTILFYHVEVWAVVSIMVGIALACLFTRLTLFLSYCQDCEHDDVFKPVFKWLIVFGMIGVGLGLLLSCIYNEPFPNQMCYEVAIGEDPGHGEETLIICDHYRHDVQQFLDGVLIGSTIGMVVWFVVRMYLVSRHIHCKQASSS